MKAVATAGDRAAFAALFDHFAPRLKAAEMVEVAKTEDLFTGGTKDERTQAYVEGRFG